MPRSNSTESDQGNQCISCRTIYITYGSALTMYYINSSGPYCKDCVDSGVNVKSYSLPT